MLTLLLILPEQLPRSFLGEARSRPAWRMLCNLQTCIIIDGERSLIGRMWDVRTGPEPLTASECYLYMEVWARTCTEPYKRS